MLAQLLSSGMGGSNDWGQMIGNLAKVFVGSRGLKKQGRLRMEEQEQAKMAQEQKALQGRESLAQLLSGMGINVDAAGAGVLGDNSSVMSRVIAEKQAAGAKDLTLKGASSRDRMA